jgi:hypothetical protein
MKQAIAGVAPQELGEVTTMTVWPSISALGGGRMWGRLYGWRLGGGLLPFGLTKGKLIAAASIPLVLPVYLLMRGPGIGIPFTRIWLRNPICRHYRLTNRRVVVECPFGGGEVGSVGLDDFDAMETRVLPGQEWYKAGELIFRKGQVETFRLSGVPRPETFRQTCLKAQRSYAGVRQALARQPVTA